MKPEFIDLKEQFAHTFFQIRQVIAMFQNGINMQMKQYGVSAAEVSLMKMVKDNTAEAMNNTSSQDIQSWLCLSKGAVSKMLSALEQKEYLNRNISQHNRRFVIITLTPAGQEIMKKLEGVINKLFMELIEQMGQENAAQFINSTNQFSDATGLILERYQSDGIKEA